LPEGLVGRLPTQTPRSRADDEAGTREKADARPAQTGGYKLLISMSSATPLSDDRGGSWPLFRSSAAIRSQIPTSSPASNLPSTSGMACSGGRLNGALLDRLDPPRPHLEMNGDSYRLKQSKQRQRQTLKYPGLAVSLPRCSLRGSRCSPCRDAARGSDPPSPKLRAV